MKCWSTPEPSPPSQPHPESPSQDMELTPLTKLILCDYYKYLFFYYIVYQGLRNHTDNSEDLISVSQAPDLINPESIFPNLISVTITNALNLKSGDIETQYEKRYDIGKRVVESNPNYYPLAAFPDTVSVEKASKSMLIIFSIVFFKGVKNAE